MYKKQGFEIRFKLEGNWKGVLVDFNSLPRTLRDSVLYAERKWGEKLVEIVKKHIINQDLGWEPKKKPSKSGSTQVMWDTGTYFRNIETWQKGYRQYVGIREGVLTGRSKVDLSRVAAIIEFKSYNGGPYRPLWRPSIREAGGQKGLQADVYNHILAKLRKMPELGKYVTT